MNINYGLKEERRVHERRKNKKKGQDIADGPPRKRTKVHGSIQINRTKELQIMEGEQLLNLRDHYRRTRDYGNKDTQVKVLKVKGIMAGNKDMREKKNMKNEERIVLE